MAEIKTTTEDRERAKRVIIEIIRQAGGRFYNTTNMYKAFAKAHVEYARNNPGCLTLWPIVKMPRGPGIHEFDVLLGQMLQDGLLHTEDEQYQHENPGTIFVLSEAGQAFDSGLKPAELAAIREGVKAVRGKSAKDVSEESHRTAWKSAKRAGDELNICLDFFSEDEYAATREELARLKAAR